jgi:ribonucleoside-diphosphate reductase alpha chain
VSYEADKITIAMTKAFLAVQGGNGAVSAKLREMPEHQKNPVEKALLRRLPAGGTIHIEEIQDQVELALTREGEHEVARSYVLYRERRAEQRKDKATTNGFSSESSVRVKGRDGTLSELIWTGLKE